MNTKVILFDQWFSSITSVVLDLKKRFGDKIYVIMISENKNHAYSRIADKFIYADWRSKDDRSLGDQYTSWLSKQIIDNDVDVAFLRKYPEFVAKYEERFSIYNCDVVFDFKNIRALSSKSSLYNMLKEKHFGALVPLHTTSDDLEEAKEFLDNRDEACLKFDNDEGGSSFRRIVDKKHIDLYSLRNGWDRFITYDEALNIIMQANSFQKMLNQAETTMITQDFVEKHRVLLMDYLHGPEKSVDCIQLGDKFISICRTKSGRAETIYKDKVLHNICKDIQDVLDIKGPFNIQFRNEIDEVKIKLKITDLNFRMSGGIYLESAIGCNLCAMYLANKFKWDCLEEMMNAYESLTVRTVTHYEEAIEIKE